MTAHCGNCGTDLIQYLPDSDCFVCLVCDYIWDDKAIVSSIFAHCPLCDKPLLSQQDPGYGWRRKEIDGRYVWYCDECKSEWASAQELEAQIETARLRENQAYIMEE